MSDNRLGISISATGAEQAAAQVDLLTRQISALNREIQRLQGGLFSGDAGKLVAQLQGEITKLQAQLTSLGGVTVATEQKIAGAIRESTGAYAAQAAAAKRAMSEAAASAALHERNVSRIIRAQRALATESVEPAIGRTLSTSELMRAQQATAQMQARRAAEQARAEAEQYSGRFLSTTEILRAREGVDRLVASLREEVLELNQVAVSAERAAVATRSVGNAMVGRESRHVVALFDEFSRGQRGQMVSSAGAMMRDSGVGTGGMLAGVGGLVAMMGGAAMIRAIDNMAKWAEQVQRAASATGMGVESYSKLQGALQLTGMKAEAADATIRKFATSIEEATANPASRAAKAFHALGVSQQDIISSGGNVQTMLNKTANAWAADADGANKAAAGEAIFGRGVEEISGLLNRGAEGIQKLQEEAQRLGITLDSGTAQALVHTGMSITQLGQTIRGDGIQSMISWLPIIDSVISDLGALAGAANKVAGALSAMVGVGSSAMKLLPSAARLPYALLHTGPFAPFANLLDSMTNRAVGPVGTADIPPVDITGERQGIGRAVSAFDTKKAGGPGKAFGADSTDARAQLADLQKQHSLFNAQQDSAFETQRIQIGMAQADKDISPMQKAEQDYQAYKAATDKKIAALTDFQAKSDSIYSTLIAQAAALYGQDSAQYKKAVGEKEAADVGFAIQNQKMQNEIAQHAMEIVQAHKQAVQQVVDAWGAAFDKIGDNIESTIEKAISNAFQPQKPEYWWSSTTGPGGQPLMQAHRINPTTALLGQLGTSVLGDLGKQIGSSIMSSIGKSLFGEGTGTFGQGIAKLIGIGSPGGLFGTGLGAVANAMGPTAAAAGTLGAGAIGPATQMAATTANTTAITTLTAAVTANTAALGTQAATGTAGTGVGAATKGAGLLGSVFGLFGGGAGGAGGIAGGIAALALSQGGIIPSAAGGWSVPSGGGNGIASILHPNEMVLPAGISKGLQNMIAGGGGSSMNLHFHGPADAPSIGRWFESYLAKTMPKTTLNTFLRGGLLPRQFSNRPV